MPSPFARRFRRVLAVLAKLVASVVLGLLLLEVAVRIVAPVDTLIAVPKRWDPVCGIRHIENGRGFIERPEYTCTFEINARGLRERDIPFARPAGEHRILCLGDSYTCGFGVAVAEAFPRLLEGELAGRDDGPWRTLNAGVGATGTANQLAWYREEGRRYGAELVVLAFVPNDFGDSAASGLFRVEDGSLIQHPAPRTRAADLLEFTRRIPGFHGFWSRSQALAHVKQIVTGAGKGDEGEVARQRRDWSVPEPVMDLSVRLVRALDADCRRDGARLLVMIVPLAPGLDMPREPLLELARRLRAADVPVLELDDALARCEAEGLRTYYADDGHWTPEGHRVFAEVLTRRVEAMLDAEESEAGSR